MFAGYEPTVQILIEKGANINATNKYGDSALLLAAAKGQYFLQHWTEIHFGPISGLLLTRLLKNIFYYVYVVIGPESLIKFMIEHEADVNTRGNEGKTALINAAYNGKLSHFYSTNTFRIAKEQHFLW